jgi:hypothetical protein
MIRICLLLLFGIEFFNCFSQTISWSGYSQSQTQTTNSYTYTSGIMTASVTHNALTRGDNTPRFVTTNTNGYCYFNGSLALNANRFNSYITSINSHITLDMIFTNGNTTNGTCSSVSFTLLNVNADESNTTFLDIIEISAIDGNNNAISSSNITSPNHPYVKTVNVTSTLKKYVGHSTTSELSNNSSFSPNSDCSIGQITVTVTPPIGTPLKSIRLKYRPAQNATTSSTTTYWTTGTQPAQQYISISNLTLTPTGGCTVLPIELLSFSGQCKNREKHFNWSTASEHNNDFFTLEHSRNGSDFYPMQEIDGAGNSTSLLNYSTHFTEEDETFVYYRLKQTDTDGATSYSDVIYVSCGEFESDLMTVFPNPSNDLIVVNFNSSISEDDYLISITDMVGKSVLDRHIAAVKNGNTVLDVSSFSNGYYFLRLIDKNTGEQLDVVRFSKID